MARRCRERTPIPTHTLAVEPDAVVVEWILTGTHLGEWRLPGRRQPIPPTGRTVRVVGADLLGFGPAGEIASDEGFTSSTYRHLM